MVKIQKLLIANRSEIAVRIIESAMDSGIQTVAVYASQDRNSRYVSIADEAYSLNGTTASETFLSPEKILAIAAQSGADALHPGYGFLSENAEFAQSVIDQGLIWVGPPPSAIRALGDKVSARKIAQEVGVPLAAGSADPVHDSAEVIRFAEENGLPVAIKAAFGGGGRGLRIAQTIEDIPQQFESASREALAAFGRGECFVERYIEKPRHVETQCLADQFGTVVVVSTRDCSLQRRHQKLIEEAPAPFLSAEQEEQLYNASKALLSAAGYVGAGTCEFLIGSDGTMSFLEVNTRLQVEHPVSEEVTGIDLVREQIRIAEGRKIDFSDPAVVGHSFEFRINGEDAGDNFLPSPGIIQSIHLPGGPGVRVDSGIQSGDVVTGEFDSLLAKLIVTGADRIDALGKAKRALAEFEITGLPTVLPFHRAMVENPIFTNERQENYGIHTTWLETEAALTIPAWRGEPGEIPEVAPLQEIFVEVDGRRVKLGVPNGGLGTNSDKSHQRKAPRRKFLSSHLQRGAGGIVKSPMQARVVKVLIEVGSKIVTGQTIFVVEAMKMEQPVQAMQSGAVSSVDVSIGDLVKSGQQLARVDTSE